MDPRSTQASLLFLVASATTLATIATGCTKDAPEAAPTSASLSGPDREASGLTPAQRGQRYLESGRPEEALKAVRACIDGTNGDCSHVAGSASMMLKDLDNARIYFEEAERLKGMSRDLVRRLGSVYDMLKRYDDAVRLYERWLAQRNNDAEIRRELGLSLILAGRAKDAIKHLEDVRRVRPTNAEVLLEVIYAHLSADQPKQARSLALEAVAKGAGTPNVFLFLSQAERSLGHKAAALEALDTGIQRHPQHRDLRLQRARQRLIKKDFQGAAKDYDALLLVDRSDTVARLGLAGAKIYLGQLDQAAELLREAEASQGPLPQIQFRRDQIAWRRGRVEGLYSMVSFARSRPGLQEAWEDVLRAAKKFKKRDLISEAQQKLSS